MRLRSSTHSTDQNQRSAAGLPPSTANVCVWRVVCLSQRFSTRGQSLQDVTASLRQGAVQPSELPVIGIVRHEMKWYSRNNQRLWCFKAAKAEAVEVCMSSVDFAFLHGLTTQTDGLSVTFFPPSQGVVNQKSLCSHRCVREEELLRFPLLPRVRWRGRLSESNQ